MLQGSTSGSGCGVDLPLAPRGMACPALKHHAGGFSTTCLECSSQTSWALLLPTPHHTPLAPAHHLGAAPQPLQAVELRTGEVCGYDMSAANLYRWHPAYAAGTAHPCHTLSRHRTALEGCGWWTPGASLAATVKRGYTEGRGGRKGRGGMFGTSRNGTFPQGPP